MLPESMLSSCLTMMFDDASRHMPAGQSVPHVATDDDQGEQRATELLLLFAEQSSRPYFLPMAQNRKHLVIVVGAIMRLHSELLYK